MAVLVWAQQYLLRRVGPDEYSLLPVLASLMMFAPLVTVVFTTALSRYVTEAFAREDHERVTQIVSSVVPFLLAIAAIVLGLGWVAISRIEHILTIAPAHAGDARIMLSMLLFSFVFRFVTFPFGTGLFVHQRFVLEDVIVLSGQILRAGLMVGLLIGVGPRVLWAVAATVVADVIAVGVTRVVSVCLVPALRFRPSQFRWALARELISFGGWTFTAYAADTVRTASPAIVLNKLSTAMDVTCFNLAYLPLQYIEYVHAQVRRTVDPVVYGMYARGEMDRIKNTYLRVGRYSLWAVLSLCVPGIVFRNEVITLYVGQEYIGAAAVMGVLLASGAAVYGTSLVATLAGATGKVKGLGLRTMLVHGGNLTVALVCVGALRMGAMGCAFGAAAGSVVLYPLFMWPLGLNLASASLREWFMKTLVPGVGPALVTLPIFVLAKTVVSADSWSGLVLSAAVGEVAYIAVVLLVFLQDADRADLGEAVRRFRVILGRLLTR